MKSLFSGISPSDTAVREPRMILLFNSNDDVESVGNDILAKLKNANAVFCQLAPWQFDYENQYNLKRSYRGTSCLVARLAGNMGINGNTPFLSRFSTPIAEGQDTDENRWLNGMYLDVPEEMDDPYRYFRW